MLGRDQNLSIKHVHVLDTVPRVNSSRVGLKQAEGKRFESGVTLISEKRVRINGERGAVVLVELKQTFQWGLITGAKQPGRWRVGLT